MDLGTFDRFWASHVPATSLLPAYVIFRPPPIISAGVDLGAQDRWYGGSPPVIGAESQPTIAAACSEQLEVVTDTISSLLVRRLTASVSDTAGPFSDRIFPPPIEALHRTGTVSDLISLLTDQARGYLNKALSGAVSDTLQVIQDAISAGSINLETPVRWVAPVSIMPRMTTLDPLYLAAHAVRHPDRYYEPRVKSYGIFTRAISAPVEFIRTGDATLTVIDPDNSVRQRIAAKTIRKAKAEVRLGPEGGSLAAFLRPLIREVGTVAQPGDGELTIPLRDYLFEKLDEKTPETWTPTSANFADVILEVLVDAMGVEDSLDRINYASFDQTRTRVAALICSGSLTESITYAELLSRLQRSSNIDIFADKNDRIAVHYTADDETPTVHLDDLLRLYKGTISQQMAEPTFNRLPYKYNRQVVGGTETWTEDVFDIEEDQTALGEIVEDEPLQMYFVADAATAAAVIERRAQYLNLDSFRFEGTIPLIPVLEDLELADLVSIEHFGGIKVGGYVAEQFKILELAMDVDNLQYHFRGIRRRLPPPAAIVTAAAITGSPSRNSRVGPYQSEVYGELFAFFQDPSEMRRLKAHHTADFGATWLPIDLASSPMLSNRILSYDTFDDGTVIHCATQEEFTGRVAYHTFSKTGKTWTLVDEEVISAASCGSEYCVSIECRYPGVEPVVYFQGDKERISKVHFGELMTRYYHRGYYTIKSGGSWSVAVMATADPGPGDYWVGPSSNCMVERVISGRENRMHFFYAVDPAVTWVGWSKDEYCRTMQADLTLGPADAHYVTSVYYPAILNLGDGCLFDERGKIAILLKGAWGAPEIEVFAEGPQLQMLHRSGTGAWSIDAGSGGTENPAGFIREHDGVLYSGQALGDGYFAIHTSDDEGLTWSAALKAGPQWPLYNHGHNGLGTVLKVSGRLYVAHFEGLNVPNYYWNALSSLPFTE